jgi:acetyl esterase/lipase
MVMHRLWRALALIPGLLLGSCSAAGIVNALVPRDGFAREDDIAYGSDPRQRLDVYRPAGAPPGSNAGRRPVVVFFYGGKWKQGDRGDYLFVGEALVARGFVVVIPDYRLYPEIRYPAFLEDGAAAVSWTLEHIGEFGGDPAHVHLMGHSAGAYSAAMLALDGRWLGAERARIRGTVGLAGPYDFLPMTDPEVRAVFADEPDATRTQPITFADGTAAPLLLVTGLDDTTVRPGNSERLAARIRAAGGDAETKLYDGIGHIGVLAALAAPLRFLAPVLDDAAAFLGRDAAVSSALQARR